MNAHKPLFLSLLTLALAACAGGEGEGAPTPQPGQAAAPAPATAEAQAGLTEADLARIVTEVMEQEYPGAHDAAGNCWRYVLEIETGGDDIAYCMRPQPAHQVQASDGSTQVYFFASNANDLGSNLEYNYTAVDMGLMAAFQVAVPRDLGMRVVASSKAMEFGTAGACGCERAEFTRLGNDYYGWMFTSGGVWQGTVVSSHEIVAPHDGVFRNLSKVPEIREDAQDVRYAVEVQDDGSAREVYPLRVVKMQSDKKVAERTLEFDRAQWAYPGIGDF